MTDWKRSSILHSIILIFPALIWPISCECRWKSRGDYKSLWVAINTLFGILIFRIVLVTNVWVLEKFYAVRRDGIFLVPVFWRPLLHSSWCLNCQWIFVNWRFQLGCRWSVCGFARKNFITGVRIATESRQRESEYSGSQPSEIITKVKFSFTLPILNKITGHIKKFTDYYEAHNTTLK